MNKYENFYCYDDYKTMQKNKALASNRLLGVTSDNITVEHDDFLKQQRYELSLLFKQVAKYDLDLSKIIQDKFENVFDDNFLDKFDNFSAKVLAGDISSKISKIKEQYENDNFIKYAASCLLCLSFGVSIVISALELLVCASFSVPPIGIIFLPFFIMLGNSGISNLQLAGILCITFATTAVLGIACSIFNEYYNNGLKEKIMEDLPDALAVEEIAQKLTFSLKV